MKRIEAIIQPFKLEAVKAQLLNLGVTGMTDGKIVLTALSDVVRIRTGEHGAEAL